MPLPRLPLLVAPVLLALGVLTAGCAGADGEVVLLNPENEPRLYRISLGPPGADSLRQQPTDLERIEPGESVVVGSTDSLAAAGGVTVTLFSIPRSESERPGVVRTEFVGSGYLRQASGHVVIGDP